jgi:hypothetical protein
VSQISPPIRIVLAAAAIFLVAWMTVLRPKTDAAPTPPAATPAGNLATGQAAESAPGKLVEKAKTAAANAAKKDAQSAGETSTGGTATATTPSTTKPAAPATAASTDTKGLPNPVARAIARDQALVLAFYNGKSAVDRAVRHAAAKVDRWNGRVFVKAVPVAKVGRYARITGGAEVEQTPTVVVVDRNLKAASIVGFTDTRSIDQLVVDALRNSGGLFTSGYLRSVNAVCSRYDRGFLTIAQPNDASQVPGYVRSGSRTWASFEAELRSVPAPKRFAGWKRSVVRDTATLTTVFADWSRALGAHPSSAKIHTETRTFIRRATPASNRLARQMKAQHVLSCAY